MWYFVSECNCFEENSNGRTCDDQVRSASPHSSKCPSQMYEVFDFYHQFITSVVLSLVHKYIRCYNFDVRRVSATVSRATKD